MLSYSPLTWTLSVVALVAVLSSTAVAQNVAVLYADPSQARVDDVVDKIDGAGVLFGSVDAIDVNAGTPSLGTLQNYDAVLVYIQLSSWADPVALGDVLAQYVDDGGGVVLFARTNHDQYAMDGAFETQNYNPFEIASPVQVLPIGPHELNMATVASHPVFDNVSGVDATSPPVYSPVRSTGTLLGSYSGSGWPFIAENTNEEAPIIAINMLPFSTDSDSVGWTATTDGAILMANALYFAAGSPSPLEIEANTGMTLERGESKTIEQTHLHTHDFGMTSPDDIVYTINITPTSGDLLRDGTALASGETLTQQDIDDGDVVYQHDGSPSLSDSFRFNVTNGLDTITAQTFSITIDEGSSLWLVLPDQVTANQGSTSVTITSIEIDYPVPATTPLELTLSLDSGEIGVEASGNVTISGDNPGTSLFIEGELADLNNMLAQGVTITVEAGTIATVTLSASVEEVGVASDDGTVPVHFDSVSVGSGARGGCHAHATGTTLAVAMLGFALLLMASLRRLRWM